MKYNTLVRKGEITVLFCKYPEQKLCVPGRNAEKHIWDHNGRNFFRHLPLSE
jgi:hypothetical protein